MEDKTIKDELTSGNIKIDEASLIPKPPTLNGKALNNVINENLDKLIIWFPCSKNISWKLLFMPIKVQPVK